MVITMIKEWFVTKEEQKQSEKRWKANKIETWWEEDDLFVNVPPVTIIYRRKPEVEEPEQLSFLEGWI